jgi:hypothetical protein
VHSGGQGDGDDMRPLLLFVACTWAVAARAADPPAPSDPVGRYNLACKYALAGERERAFEWLDKAVQAGFNSDETFARDPDLATLRSDPRFAALLDKVKVRAHPCPRLAEARQLDFWLGEWEVRDPQNHVVGHSSIQRLLDGCVVYESWTGTLGGSGKSFNFWDGANHRWQQTWVDDKGGVQQYFGQLRQGALRYEGALQASGAARVRLSFIPLPGGKVRQLAERSSDGGQSWTTTYDFVYSRAAAADKPKS